MQRRLKVGVLFSRVRVEEKWIFGALERRGLDFERIHFLGHLPHADYLRVLQVSAVHVYLTYPFVLSWSCVEAMSAGCVVVGSRTAPVQEVIEQGRDGLPAGLYKPAAGAGCRGRLFETVSDRCGFRH